MGFKTQAGGVVKHLIGPCLRRQYSISERKIHIKTSQPSASFVCARRARDFFTSLKVFASSMHIKPIDLQELPETHARSRRKPIQ